MKGFISIAYALLICFLIKNITALSNTEKAAITSKFISVGFQCVKDHPLTLAEIKAFKNKMFPEGNNPKCFAACIFKKFGIMDNEGMLSPATARKNAEQVFKGNDDNLKNVEEIMQFCSTVNQQSTGDGNKGCDRAKLAYTCLMDNGPKYGFDLDF